MVIFTSDNGPSIESYLPRSYAPNYPTFFGGYGPFDGIKRDCWEGGLRMPTIAAWPGHIKAGKVIETPSMLSDWFATLADAAHIPAPARTDGVSLMPSLTGIGQQQQGLVYVEYYENERTPSFKEFEASRRGRLRNQMQTIRIDSLVGVRYNIGSADDDFEIYNAVTDQKEVINLAPGPEYANIQALMKAKVLQARHSDPEAPRPYDDTPIPASKPSKSVLPGIGWQYYKGNFHWVIKPGKLAPNKTGTSTAIDSQVVKNTAGMIAYTGYIEIPHDGRYTFSLTVKGKAYVRLHEATLIDADFGYKTGEKRTQTVNLKAGLHDFSLYCGVTANSQEIPNFICTDEFGVTILTPARLYHITP